MKKDRFNNNKTVYNSLRKNNLRVISRKQKDWIQNHTQIHRMFL